LASLPCLQCLISPASVLRSAQASTLRPPACACGLHEMVNVISCHRAAESCEDAMNALRSCVPKSLCDFEHGTFDQPL